MTERREDFWRRFALVLAATSTLNGFGLGWAVARQHAHLAEWPSTTASLVGLAVLFTGRAWAHGADPGRLLDVWAKIATVVGAATGVVLLVVTVSQGS